MENTWEILAHYVASVYDTEVNLEEEYFICPECGEPVYACDYMNEDYFRGKNAFYTRGKIYCPICETQLNDTGEEDD